MSTLRIPTVPNSPVTSVDDVQTYGVMKLRLNEALDFIENAEFDSLLATYDDNYQNSQAHSKLFVEHMKEVLEILKKQLPKYSRAVEVGCGKGDFVELLQADGHFVVSGYDATYEGDNPSIQQRYLIPTDRVEADLVILRHVLEHVHAPHKFLSMLKVVFGKAQIYIEVPNYDWIAENQAFFDITYEHVNYFSQSSLLALFDKPVAKSGLCFNRQYQYVIADISSVSSSFADAYENGKWVDLEFEALFPSLSEKISTIENRLGVDSKLYVWGAATKGCMFLVHCANQNRLLNKVGFAIDANPEKCGKFLPGSLIPIKSKDDFFEAVRRNDVLLISNPNYRDEIVGEIESHGIEDLDVVCL